MIRKNPRREMLIAGCGGANRRVRPAGRRAPRAESAFRPTAYANGQGSATVGWPVIAVLLSRFRQNLSFPQPSVGSLSFFSPLFLLYFFSPHTIASHRGSFVTSSFLSPLLFELLESAFAL